MLSLSHGRGFPPPQTPLILRQTDRLRHKTVSRNQRSSVHFPSAFMCNTGPSLALRSWLICTLSPACCPALLAPPRYRERGKGKESHEVQPNTPEEFSPTEWEHCGAAQTNSGVCVPTKVPKGRGEVKKQEHQPLDCCCCSSSTLTSHYPQPGEQGTFVGVKVCGGAAVSLVASHQTPPVADVFAGLECKSWSLKDAIYTFVNIQECRQKHKQALHMHTQYIQHTSSKADNTLPTIVSQEKLLTAQPIKEKLWV